MYNKNLSALLPPSNLGFMSKYFIFNSISMKNDVLWYKSPPPHPLPLPWLFLKNLFLLKSI